MNPPTQVLIVEDDKAIAQAFCDYLSWQGFRCVSCSNGEEALEILTTTPVSLVILDLKMPVMSGEEFLQIKARHPDFRDTPVIVVTAQQSPAKPGPGVSRVFRKPLDMEDLLMELRQFCQAA